MKPKTNEPEDVVETAGNTRQAGAGLAQAACVGIWAGSWSILFYVATGFFVWNFFVRPLEEADLLDRFRQPFEKYRDAVWCWIPRLTPFRAD